MKLNNEQIIEIHSLFDSNIPSKEIFNQFSDFSNKAIDKVIRESGRSFSERTKKNKTILDNKIYELFDNNSTVATIVAQIGKDSQYVKKTLKNRDPNVDFGRSIAFPNKEEQEEILEFFNDGSSFDDMIKIYKNKYSKHALKEVIRDLGISLRRKKPAHNRIHTTEEQDNKILELFDNDAATVDIVKEVNISESAILRVLKENGRDFKSRSKKIYYDGYVNHNKVLFTKKQKSEILKLYNEGKTINEIKNIIGHCVIEVIKSFGLRPVGKNNKKLVPDEQMQEFVNQYRSGMTYEAISEKTKYSKKQICDWLAPYDIVLTDEVIKLKIENQQLAVIKTNIERHGVENTWQLQKVIDNNHRIIKGGTIPERLIHEILDEFGVKYEKSNRSLLNGKELDVYIPELNLAIEVNGMYWHSTKFKENSYHLSKTKLCDKLGIQLLHFWDMEIINNFDLVKNFIRNKVKKNENKIFARKCKVVEISQKEMKDFLNKNHLQQFSDARFKYALEYNGQLVSIMTFSATRFNKNYDYELVRFCSLANHNVIGGAQKLLSAFRKKNQGSIISYAQRNYSTGSIYETLGFTLDGTSAPSPVYLNGSEIFRRGSSKAFLPETLTCYNSGNYRYILK